MGEKYSGAQFGKDMKEANIRSNLMKIKNSSDILEKYTLEIIKIEDLTDIAKLFLQESLKGIQAAKAATENELSFEGLINGYTTFGSYFSKTVKILKLTNVFYIADMLETYAIVAIILKDTQVGNNYTEMYSNYMDTLNVK
jgi:hypothetical protein